MTRKQKKRRTLLILALVITLLLTVVLGIALGRLREQRRLEREVQEARQAGILNYAPELPRNTYGLDGFSKENDRVRYEDDRFTTVTGIDVSSHQEAVDWTAVAGDGISFALIQAGYRGYTDGALGEDVRFRENLAGAKAAGLQTGIYFFSQALNEEEAKEEAEFVLELLDGEALDLPVFYDWEGIDSAEARTDGLDGETITACAKTFCETVEAGGYEAGIYFNQSYVYTVIDLAQLTDYPLWLAQYRDVPDCIYDFGFWQYTDSGTVAGITPPVDLNVRFVEK
jgi:GH25 family lysozyme M1 (1,4-beta-N-acetylmuramidase)